MAQYYKFFLVVLVWFFFFSVCIGQHCCTNKHPLNLKWFKHGTFILIHITPMSQVSWFWLHNSPHSESQAEGTALKWKYTVPQIWHLADLFIFYCSKYVIEPSPKSQRKGLIVFPQSILKVLWKRKEWIIENYNPTSHSILKGMNLDFWTQICKKYNFL